MRRIISTACLSMIAAVAAGATPITSLSSTALNGVNQLVQPVIGMSTPEPSTIAMMAVGASLIALKLRRRR